MKKKKSKGVPMSVKLVKSMLKSIYRDADKGMWVCETWKGLPLLIPCTASSREMFDIVWKVNREQGIKTEASIGICKAPEQLGLFA